MSSKSKTDEEVSVKLAWHKHNIENFQYFRSLNIRTKFSAIEGMADTIRKLRELRHQRKK